MGSDNIQAFGRFCKVALGDLIHEWGLVMAIILVGLASFDLGRLSGLDNGKLPISMTQAPPVATPGGMQLGGEYVASRTGTVYYFPWCGSAGNISPSDQVWFKTETAARQAGYSPAKNCLGLGAE